jgi:predicted amino acid racemase
MSYIEVNGNIIIQNLNRVLDVCKKHSVSLTVVTKFFTSDISIVGLLHENGVDSIADTNITNFSGNGFKKLVRCKKSLIKTGLSGIQGIPALPPFARADRLFVSDEALLAAVESLPENLRPETVLIAEAGDLRDGFYMEAIPETAARYRNARIIGAAANFGCLSGKMPEAAVILRLLDCARAMPVSRPPFVSVGGTVVYPLLESGALDKADAELRMGEGIFFGWDSSSGSALKGFDNNGFTLYGEIIEIREKLIAPIQGAGHTAFGGRAAPRKLGRRLCAVLNFGALAASMDDLEPLDQGITTAGQTYDFTIADITESHEQYRTGGYIPFRAMYAAAARAFLNPYIKRVIV